MIESTAASQLMEQYCRLPQHGQLPSPKEVEKADVVSMVTALWNGQPVRTEQYYSEGGPLGTVIGRVAPLTQAGKGMLAEVKLDSREINVLLYFRDTGLKKIVAYYPQPEGCLDFAISAQELRDGSPGSFLPGSVGSLVYGTSGYDGIFEWVQGSFKKGTPASLTDKKVRKYGGWRYRLFEHACKALSQKGLRSFSFSFSNLKQGDPMYQDLDLAATKYGYSLHPGKIILRGVKK